MKLLELFQTLQKIKEQQGIEFMSNYDVEIKQPYSDTCPAYVIHDQYRLVTIYCLL